MSEQSSTKKYICHGVFVFETTTHQADGRLSGIVRAGSESPWALDSVEDRWHWSAPVRVFFAQSACKIGGGSSVREITLIGSSGKRISAEKRNEI